MSSENVRARLENIVRALSAQVSAIEKHGSEAFYGPLFEDVPKADYWVFVGAERLRHVADKISASLASTGTPSYFLDLPDSAAHLAVLTSTDRVLHVHRPGEASDRLVSLLAALPTEVPLDCITTDPGAWRERVGSRRSGHVLPVALPSSVAPGVESDIVSLALGDSLLCGLESVHGFTALDFLKDHPKGSLGRNIAAAQARDDEAAVEHLAPADAALAAVCGERDGVAQLAADLDDGAVSRWWEVLRTPWTRVITTGMGKPGYCMRYLATLLNEEGRSAFYTHPAEGVHGDLGRIGPGSLVIAYSHSGETDEILNILPRMKERGATLLSLTSNPDSTLGQASDVALKAGAPEVDPIRKAPTGSTTAALALATALVCADVPA